jgi:hypothetical protein
MDKVHNPGDSEYTERCFPKNQSDAFMPHTPERLTTQILPSAALNFVLIGT